MYHVSKGSSVGLDISTELDRIELLLNKVTSYITDSYVEHDLPLDKVLQAAKTIGDTRYELAKIWGKVHSPCQEISL